MPFKEADKKDETASDTFGSLSTVGVKTERYFFENHYNKRLLIIMIEKIKGTASKWEMWLPDYSSLSEKISAGTAKLNGATYSTGTYLWSEKDGLFLDRTYARILGPVDNIRLQIHYMEIIHTSAPTPEFIQAFQTRADDSFTIMPYTETAPTRTFTGQENNEHIKQNTDKKDGTDCIDSLGCTRGFFCKDNKCVKGFTD